MRFPRGAETAKDGFYPILHPPRDDLTAVNLAQLATCATPEVTMMEIMRRGISYTGYFYLLTEFGAGLKISVVKAVAAKTAFPDWTKLKRRSTECRCRFPDPLLHPCRYLVLGGVKSYYPWP